MDATQRIELKETHTQRVPRRRRRIQRGESELRETNHCAFSLVCHTTCDLVSYLYFRFDLLWCVVSVCLSITPSCICAGAQDGKATLIWAGSAPDRSDWSPKSV